MELAVQDDDVFIYSSPKARERGLEAAEKLSVKCIRVNVLWARVQVGNPRARKVPKTRSMTSVRSTSSSSRRRGATSSCS